MKEINEYPVVLTVEHICEILSVSKPTAYDLMEATGFPLFRFGRNKRVMRDKFFDWLHNTDEVA